MGAWGEKSFENDAALDWVAELQAEGVGALRSVLQRVGGTGDGQYLGADASCAALAAAEIVAAGLGRGRDRVDADACVWLDGNETLLGPSDLQLALNAVHRVIGRKSELRSLWDDDADWYADVAALIARLGGAPASNAPHDQEPLDPETLAVLRGTAKQVLLAFLAARGLVPTEVQHARIASTSGAADMDRWLARALLAESVAAVLDDG